MRILLTAVLVAIVADARVAAQTAGMDRPAPQHSPATPESLANRQDGAPQPSIDADVQGLLWLDSRDAALRRILQRGIYRGQGTYVEGDQSVTVRHVAVCPQPDGAPIFAVFAPRRSVPGVRVIDDEPADRTLCKGHVILVAADGAIVRCYQGMSSVDGYFGDPNGDGVIDRVETMRITHFADERLPVSQLLVLPITEAMTPALRVAFDAGDPAHRSTWRVIPASDTKPARIELGAKDPNTGTISDVAATWVWDRNSRAWVGPNGGPDGEFMVLPPIGFDELKDFVMRASEHR